MEVFFIAIWLFCGIIAGVIANRKGRSGCGWFLLGILLGPFAFAVALLPDIGLTKKCPKCAEEIKVKAVVCRFCGYEFPPPPPPDASKDVIVGEKITQETIDELWKKREEARRKYYKNG